jgi:hypothetical protein
VGDLVGHRRDLLDGLLEALLRILGSAEPRPRELPQPASESTSTIAVEERIRRG